MKPTDQETTATDETVGILHRPQEKGHATPWNYQGGQEAVVRKFVQEGYWGFHGREQKRQDKQV